MLCRMSEQPLSEQTTQTGAGRAQEETATSRPTPWWILPIIGGAIVALDQTAKYLVTTRLELGESWEFIPAIAKFIKITYSENQGAAFGMLPQASDLFLILALVTVGVFILSYSKLPSHAILSRISIGLISGGALSNAFDRIRFNYVIDYVHVQIGPTISNISNFADHAITIGVILLLIDQWRAEQRQVAEKAAQAAESSEPADAPRPSSP